MYSSKQRKDVVSLSVIKQTNKTLLIDSINPERLNLLTMIGEVKNVDSLSDEKVQEIVSYLEVSSFDEVLEKFVPVVYSCYNANNQKVMYTLERPENVPENMLTEIYLNKHLDFLKMLLTLVETKRSQGIMNVDFKFEKLLELISPAKVMDDIKQVRADLRYTYGEYAKLEEGDPKKLDVADKLNVLMEEASENYSNVLAMLPLAIEDIKTRLLLGVSDNEKDSTPLALGMLTMGDEGELKVLEAPKVETTALAEIDDHVNEGLMEAIHDDYEAVCDHQSPYVKALAIRTFCPLASTSEQAVHVATEVQNYNSYLDFYKHAKEDFIKVVKPLAEKLLGIKAFFDQYPDKIKGGMKPKLLIANCTPEMLAKSSNLPRLIAYLNSVNEKNDYTNTIWHAIVPSIAWDARQRTKLTRERFKGNTLVENPYVNSTESLVRLMDVLKDYRIRCFFSFEGNEFTTFNQLATEGAEPYIERCMPLTDKQFSEFAIPCLPNFTVVPKDKSGVILDKRMQLSEDGGVTLSKEKEDIMRLWVEGVYIGAAYVAAGLMAACQCPAYLKKIFKRNVDAGLPGVRFDIEQGDNALRAKTTMAKEITGFTTSIKDQINRLNFGFVFSSENATCDGENIAHITVYKARCLMTSGNSYEPTYKTKVSTYIERVLRHATGDFKADNIREFFSNRPSSQKSQWLEKKGKINGIIQMGDDIEFNIDEESGICTLDATFNGDSKNLEIEIKRHAAATT